MEKHLQIRSHLLGRIRSGHLGVGQKIPSEYELAMRFKVNKTTINKAVATLVNEGYVERRKGAGTFVTNPFAGAAPLIGMYTNLRMGTYFSQLLMGAQEEAASRGYGLTYFQAHNDDSGHFWKYMRSTQPVGFLINRPFKDPLPDIPTLFVDTYVADPKAESVQVDHRLGGRRLAEYFIERGHHHVAFISQDSSRDDLMERARGFLGVYEEQGLGESAQRLHSFSKSQHNLFSVLQRLLLADHRITGLVFDSDHVALHAIRLLRKLGRNVPSDISVAGFGHVLPFDYFVNLTTVEQFPISLGQMAVAALIDRMEGRKPEPIKIVGTVELIKGETVTDRRRRNS